jgi:hypothetical protein
MPVNIMLYVIYFGVAAALTLTMPSAIIITLLGSMLRLQLVEQVGYLFVFISCIPSLGWNLIAFFVSLSLIRTPEKITSQMNLAALTALAHCGYYGVLALWCYANNDLKLNFGLVSEKSQLDAFWVFSGIYLYALSFANIHQLNVFRQKLR